MQATVKLIEKFIASDFDPGMAESVERGADVSSKVSAYLAGNKSPKLEIEAEQEPHQRLQTSGILFEGPVQSIVINNYFSSKPEIQPSDS